MNSLFKPKYVLRWTEAFIFFYLFGKFYYIIFGFDATSKPYAPGLIIILKDALLVCYLSFIGILVANKKIHLDQEFGYYFSMFLLLFLSLSSIHLLNLDFLEWVQHHIRNTLFFFSFIFIGYEFVSQKRFFDLVIIFCTLNAPAALINWLYFPERTFNLRAIAFLDNPNTLAGVLSIGIIMALVLYIKVGQLRYLLAVCCMMAGLVTTFSMTYLLLVIALVCFYLVYNMRRGYFPLIILSTFVTCVIIWGSTSDFALKLINRITGIYLALSYDVSSLSTLGDRSAQYQGFPDYIQRSNLLQILFGNFQAKNYLRYDSIYLVIGTDFGLIALLIFLLMLAYLGFRLVQARKETSDVGEEVLVDIALLLLVALLVSGLAHNLLNRFPVNVLYFLFFGVLFKTIRSKGCVSSILSQEKGKESEV